MRFDRLSSALLLPALLLLGAALLSGCGLGRALGSAKVSPDEFNIVTKAPLVIPPDYSLKPPAPSEKNDEADTAADAQSALVGKGGASTQAASPGERALVAQAGAEYADPLIRAVIDQEYAGLVDKSPDLTERLIFWTATPTPTVNAQVNAGAESIRIERQQSGAKNQQRADTSAQAAQPSSSVPDQVEGQKKPTIGKTHSRLLDGIF
ncbi:MAG: DUF3035 domain-containing protein [Alphaproteobacteria bacterium]